MFWAAGAGPRDNVRAGERRRLCGALLTYGSSLRIGPTCRCSSAAREDDVVFGRISLHRQVGPRVVDSSGKWVKKRRRGGCEASGQVWSMFGLLGSSKQQVILSQLKSLLIWIAFKCAFIYTPCKTFSCIFF